MTAPQGKLLAYNMGDGFKLYIGQEPLRGMVIYNGGLVSLVTLESISDTEMKFSDFEQGPYTLNDGLRWIGSKILSTGRPDDDEKHLIESFKALNAQLRLVGDKYSKRFLMLNDELKGSENV